MTTLINTRSGGKTEARVGDVVRCSCCPIPEPEILSYPLNNRGWMFQSGMFAGSLDGYVLLSRPFAVGDSAEYLGLFIDGTKGKEPEWFPVDWENGDKQKRADFMNANPELYRHANPDWRREYETP
jgi:hypothetical protein